MKLTRIGQTSSISSKRKGLVGNLHSRTIPCLLKQKPYISKSHSLLYLCPSFLDDTASIFRVQASKADASPDCELRVGTLVEVKKDERAVLLLLTGPDGKKNWWAVDTTGRKQSIQPKHVTYTISGGPYTSSDLETLTSQPPNLDDDSLCVAWEIAAESGGNMSLSELCDLLLGSTSPRDLYNTYRALAKDRLYFKQVSKDSLRYEVRTAAAVEANRQQLAIEAAAAADRAEWGAEMRQLAKSPRSVAMAGAQLLSKGKHSARVEALKLFALKGGDVDRATANLAIESCSLAGGGGGQPSEVVALLIATGFWRRHEQIALERRGLPTGHTPSTVQEAEAIIRQPPPDLDASTRQDLSHLQVYAIDDASTTEVDDALSWEQTPDGSSRIWIHIADPTRWISPGGQLDQSAASRGRSLYFPWGNVPMFPRELAQGPFSLAGDMESLAISVMAELDEEGGLAEYQVVPSRVRVTHSLTYDSADEILEASTSSSSDSSSESSSSNSSSESSSNNASADSDLANLLAAATLRKSWRTAHGCIEIPIPEAKISVPREDLDLVRPRVSITRISQVESRSRGLVAEMMILAGEAVGALGAEHGIPLPYRGQEDPRIPPEKDLQALSPLARAYALRRCMTRSTVTSMPQRHASLALDSYVQFTSPIRRYSDTIAHFQLKAWLRGAQLPYSSSGIESALATSAPLQKEMGAAEREGEDYWVAEYLRQHDDEQWTAIMMGWARQDLSLAAVLLVDLGLQTAVKCTGEVKPGDGLLLSLKEASPRAGKYQFYVSGSTAGEEVPSQAVEEPEPLPGNDEITEEMWKWAEEAGAAAEQAVS